MKFRIRELRRSIRINSAGVLAGKGSCAKVGIERGGARN